MAKSKEKTGKKKARLERERLRQDEVERRRLEELSEDPKQIRARARRARRARKHMDAYAKQLYSKPIEDWDVEELARGRPRAKDGTFKGAAPRWLDRRLYEEAMKRFKDVANADIRALVPEAIETVEVILRNDTTDDKGRPLVPASVKLEAAKWLVEHVVGKPVQRREEDITLRLQGILAHSIVSPNLAETAGYQAAVNASSPIALPMAARDPAIIEAELVDEEEDDD